MKFAIEEQGKSGVNKVTEITDSHFSNSEWRLQHKERASAENEIKKLKRELVEEKKKPATHKNPIKVQSPKRIADLEKAIKDQEKIRDEADEKMKEIEKSFNNQDIVKYLQSTDLNRDMARDDGTAWCASFLNWCIEATGKYKGLKKDAASAESWRKWGEKISEPRYGAITIVTRSSNPVKYHVGFYTGVKDVSKKIETEEVDVVGKNGKIKKEKKVKDTLNKSRFRSERH